MKRDEIEDELVGKRREPRTSLTLRAALAAASASGPVTIRNLSRNGGMIEGEALPAVGETLQVFDHASQTISRNAENLDEAD